MSITVYTRGILGYPMFKHLPTPSINFGSTVKLKPAEVSFSAPGWSWKFWRGLESSLPWPAGRCEVSWSKTLPVLYDDVELEVAGWCPPVM